MDAKAEGSQFAYDRVAYPAYVLEASRQTGCASLRCSMAGAPRSLNVLGA